MTTAAESAEETIAMTCAGCDRAIERCAFCGLGRCPSPSCYACMVVDLGQSMKRLHEHGG
jgi:hypothetical protein